MQNLVENAIVSDVGRDFERVLMLDWPRLGEQSHWCNYCGNGLDIWMVMGVKALVF